MNKKANTALFFTLATLVNIILVMVLSLGLFLGWYYLLGHQFDIKVNTNAMLISILAGLGISFPLYKLLVVWFSKRVDVDKHFEPSVRLLVRKSSPRDKNGLK